MRVAFPEGTVEVPAHRHVSGDNPTSPNHTELHVLIADVLNALQAKVGADDSDLTSSHDYKIRALEVAIENIYFDVTIADVEGRTDALNAIIASIAGKSDIGHTHDDRYFTEAEVTALLAGKANTSLTHAISDVTGLQTALDSSLQFQISLMGA